MDAWSSCSESFGQPMAPRFRPPDHNIEPVADRGDIARMGTLIVGASIAGVRTAQALRMLGYADDVTLIGEEPHAPYDKPPLSKEMLGQECVRVPLLSDDELAALSLDLRLGVRATAVEPARRVVRTEAGETFGYDHLVIATGVKARVLPGVEHLTGVYTVRTSEDAVALHEALDTARQLVVVGAGFIGSEVAAAARRRGLSVDIVEPQAIPMSHLFGPEVGAQLARLHEINGVTVHAGVGVAGFDGRAVVSGVRLTDGRTLPADLVVVGIGAIPATDWLISSGLPIANGIDCDEGLRVLGAEGIYAAGDIARWPCAFADEPIRIEHWTNANEHGAIVAASIMGVEAPRTQPPYVWSDQYGHRVQVVGLPRGGRLARMTGSVDDGTLIALFADAQRKCVAALVLDDARALMRCRRAVATRAVVDEGDLGVAVGP